MKSSPEKLQRKYTHKSCKTDILTEENKMNKGTSDDISSNKSVGDATVQGKQVGDTWIQKASWKTLVGDSGSVNFSLTEMLGLGGSQQISPVMPCTNGIPTDKPKVKFHPPASSTVANTRSMEKERVKLKSRSNMLGSEHIKVDAEKISGNLKAKKEGTDIGMSDPASMSYKICTFMRSPNAEQEWLESKRMLKDVAKTRRKEALRSTKKLHKPFLT